MKTITSLAAIRAFAICAVVFALPSHAEHLISIRAIGPHVFDNEAVVQWVAQHAASVSPPPTGGVDDRDTSVEKIATALCGRYFKEYFNIFVDRNKSQASGLTPSQPLGQAIDKYEWPACLYAYVPSGGYRTRVKITEKSATDVYKRLTGGGGTMPALETFFKASINQKVDIKTVQFGTVLVGAHITRPVTLTLGQISADLFWDGLVQRAGGEVKRQALFNRVDEQQTASVIVGDSEDCDSQDEPFPAAHVIKAHEHSRKRADSYGIDDVRAAIFIVDNGFFGADPRGGRPSRFKESAFREQDFEIKEDEFAVSLRIQNRNFSPLNYTLKDLVPDVVSGHGTHVLGLILGGPSFTKYWDDVRNKKPWVRISIVNVADGQKTLLMDPNQIAGSLPSQGAIVNFSISYDLKAAPSAAASFESMVSQNQNLYIAAAGNNNEDVTMRRFPAALGGLERPNLISVAAVDAKGKIAPFSNVSRRNVDMAAPGCEIKSWIRNQATETYPLSGTSQAAPFVSFTAALLRTLIGPSNPSAKDLHRIKARIVTSGSLLDTRGQELVASRATLNVQHAMFWFDDYINVARGPNQGRYIGTVKQLTGLRCMGPGHGPANKDDVWSIKRDKQKLWSYMGRSTVKLDPPCESAESQNASFAFEVTHRLSSTTGELQPVSDLRIDDSLNHVDEIIFRTHR